MGRGRFASAEGLRLSAWSAALALLLVSATQSTAQALESENSLADAAAATLTLDLGVRDAGFAELVAGRSVTFGFDGAEWYAWGPDGAGQLSGGSSVESDAVHRLELVQRPAGETAESFAYTRIVSGARTTYALGSDGVWYGWGDNAFGQLGLGTVSDSEPGPAPIGKPAGAAPDFTYTELVAESHSATVFALGSDGVWYAWGQNSYGLLADGTMDHSATPEPLGKPSAAKRGFAWEQAVLGGAIAYGLGSDGVWYFWGVSAYGSRGDGTVGGTVTVPVKAGSPPGVVYERIVAGNRHAFGLGSDGLWYAWGGNDSGQLGVNRTTPLSGMPVPLPVFRQTGGFSDVFAVGNSSFGLSQGQLFSWGSNDQGQLGLGTRGGHRVAPAAVSLPAGLTVDRFSADSNRAFASASDGSWYGWGVYGLAPEFVSGGLAMQVLSSRPTVIQKPADVLTALRIDDVPADPETFADLGGGRWQVTVPSCPVPGSVIEAHWALGSHAQPPVILEKGIECVGGPRAETPSEPDTPAEPDAPTDPSTPSEPLPDAPAEPRPDTSPDTPSEPVRDSESTPAEAAQAAQAEEPKQVLPTALMLGPRELSVADGDIARFEAVASGWPLPEVWWEASRDGGKSWTAYDGRAHAEVIGTYRAEPEAQLLAEIGSTIEVPAPSVGDSRSYRMVARNSAGVAHTEPVALVSNARKAPEPRIESRWQLPTEISVTAPLAGAPLVVGSAGGDHSRR